MLYACPTNVDSQLERVVVALRQQISIRAGRLFKAHGRPFCQKRGFHGDKVAGVNCLAERLQGGLRPLTEIALRKPYAGPGVAL